MSTNPVKIVGIPGSLREHSFNRALIKAAVDTAPDGIRVEMFLLHDVPLYHADVEAQGDPKPVAALKDAIASADGVLFATPQYNGSISGVLKNAIDWASRPAFQSVLVDKPAAIIGASSGRSATVRAREDLVRILNTTRCKVMDAPTIGLANSGDVIEDGELQSDEVRSQIRRLLSDFGVFVRAHVLAEAAD